MKGTRKWTEFNRAFFWEPAGWVSLAESNRLPIPGDYKERMKGLAPVDFTESALNSRDDTELNANNGANGPDAFCDGDKCTI